MANPNINNPAEYKRVHKKQYEVYCCMPPLNTHWHNKLEGSNYLTDEKKRFVLSGTVGETWVIDAGKLAKTYRVATTNEPITEDLFRSKFTQDLKGQMIVDWFKLVVAPDASVCHAMFLPVKYKASIPTSWGDVLQANRAGVEHGLGDFIICADDGYGRPNMNDRWVVNGAIFPNTYDMHAFPGMMAQIKEAEMRANKGIAKPVTPVPKSILYGVLQTPYTNAPQQQTAQQVPQQALSGIRSFLQPKPKPAPAPPKQWPDADPQAARQFLRCMDCITNSLTKAGFPVVKAQHANDITDTRYCFTVTVKDRRYDMQVNVYGSTMLFSGNPSWHKETEFEMKFPMVSASYAEIAQKMLSYCHAQAK